MKTFIQIIAAIADFIVSGFVLKALWAWFVVPLGVMELGFWHAMGLAATISLFTFDSSQLRHKMEDETSEEKVLKAVGIVIAKLFILFVAWLYHFGV